MPESRKAHCHFEPDQLVAIRFCSLSDRIAAMERTAIKRGLNIADALGLRSLWEGLPSPRSIVTSPPYLDMHDYGNASLIGLRGQSVEAYLSNMLQLFCDCYLVSTPDATFWLVAGSIRREKRLILLPELLVRCAEDAGWKLRESVTWDKQKALPWTHHGQFRDITEQVYLLSKSDDFQFNATELRSPIPNSVWWRRYPERYSPDGSMPTNLWSIPIPTQGAWSGIRTHFCPFPEELTYRMLSLTTVAGDVVLDPLAGVGSVPAMAEAMGRVGYGLELTAGYKRFYQHVAKSAETFLSSIGEGHTRREIFRKTIIELRLLKFARLLARQIAAAGLPIQWVRVEESTDRPRQEHHVVSAVYDLVMDNGSDHDPVILDIAGAAIGRAPLSKFGIDAKIVATKQEDAASDGYWYFSGRFWSEPNTTRPVTGEPHVVARFKPEPDLLDDMPYP